MSVALGLLGGVAVDAALGDPQRGHPVAAFGRSTSALEERMYAPAASRGATVGALAIAGAAVPVLLVDRLLGRRGVSSSTSPLGTAPLARLGGVATGELARLAAGSLVIWTCLGGRSLWAIGDQLAERLEAGDLEGARALVPSLAGRDPSQLDASGMARAATESIAENTADAVLGTLVWGAAFGPVGAVIHRASNTLDAMHGHKSPRYLNFGMPAARLDDALGFIPARLGAWLTVALAPLIASTNSSSPGNPVASTNSSSLGNLTPFAHRRVQANRVRLRAGGRRGRVRGSRWAAARVLWRDGRDHPSPNAGPMEAAFAGALGVRLGGPLMYGDRAEVRGTLNADGRDPDAQGLRDAVRLSRAVSYATLGVVIAARLLVGRFGAVSPLEPGPLAGRGVVRAAVGRFGAVSPLESGPLAGRGLVRAGGLR